MPATARGSNAAAEKPAKAPARTKTASARRRHAVQLCGLLRVAFGAAPLRSPGMAPRFRHSLCRRLPWAHRSGCGAGQEARKPTPSLSETRDAQPPSARLFSAGSSRTRPQPAARCAQPGALSGALPERPASGQRARAARLDCHRGTATSRGQAADSRGAAPRRRPACATLRRWRRRGCCWRAKSPRPRWCEVACSSKASWWILPSG